ncbi:MAG: hypothetical protein ACOX2F_11615 [bacterium]
MKRLDLSPYISPDKSSLIRGFLFSLLTEEKVLVSYSDSFPKDIKTAFKCLKKFRKKIILKNGFAEITGKSVEPDSVINCGNSATVMHLLMGIACFKGWKLELTGDKSLLNRNHSSFYEAEKLYKGKFIETELLISSAQLKSFHLLAMLKNGGKLHYTAKTRENTEVLLKEMGAEILTLHNSIEVKPAEKLRGYALFAKLDPSGSFIAASAALILNKPFVISGIYPEKLRMKPFNYLKKAGYQVKTVLKKGGYEVSWDGSIKKGVSKVVISKNKVTEVVDEIPFIAYLAARAGVCFELKNGGWLRNKESDRVHESAQRIGKFFETAETVDGFTVGKRKKKGAAKLFSSSDHRMEMVSKLISLDQKIKFEVKGSYAVSFPEFLKLIEFLEKK